MISKALIVGTYQKKLEEMAAVPDIDLTVVVPPCWIDERGTMPLERVYTQGYDLRVTEIALNGHFHLHYYPRLKKIIQEVQPDVVHIDEEPYNVASFQAMRLARRVGARTVVFTWQNLRRSYPPPFRWIERYVLRNTDALIAGNSEAIDVWRAKKYGGPIYVIPQFGVDPRIFQRQEHAIRKSKPSILLRRSARRPSQPHLTIGYVGRLVPQKGIDILLQAAARLEGPWDLKILGGGPERYRLERMAQWLGISGRVTFSPQLPSTHLPNYLSGLDVLVLPSLSRPNWKEQFGRVLVEAMACNVVVVGAESGAIPEVVGDAGLTFPEGDIEALHDRLQRLLSDPELRQTFQKLGRQHVTERFTQAAIARATVKVYRQILGETEDEPTSDDLQEVHNSTRQVSWLTGD
ncbi:MAG: glycosyltransferase [Anaerolineae bacterium]